MNRGICKLCGGTFWESFKGARGEDVCDNCEAKALAETFTIGQDVTVDGRSAVVRSIDYAGVHVEFRDAPEIGTWAHHPDDVTAA